MGQTEVAAQSGALELTNSIICQKSHQVPPKTRLHPVNTPAAPRKPYRRQQGKIPSTQYLKSHKKKKKPPETVKNSTVCIFTFNVDY